MLKLFLCQMKEQVLRSFLGPDYDKYILENII